MASDVSICSNALIMLGQKPIASFTQAGAAAQAASNLYPDAKRDFLRSHPWNAAIKRRVLAPLAAAPEFGAYAQFQLPEDWLRTLSAEDSAEQGLDFRQEGRRLLLLTSTNAVYLRYVAQVAESEWDAKMVEAMTVKMAALMAYAITSSASLAESLASQAKTALREAKSIDGQEDPPEAIEDSPLLASRLPGGGW